MNPNAFCSFRCTGPIITLLGYLFSPGGFSIAMENLTELSFSCYHSFVCIFLQLVPRIPSSETRNEVATRI